jgi:CHAD domain-containing protein
MTDNTENTSIAIYQFLDEQMLLFRDLLLQIDASMEEETIHRLRVSVKKIRTIQKLKKYINFPKIIDKRQYKAIREIFALSGQMRDLQIQQNLLRGYTKSLKFSFPELSQHLTQKEQLFADDLHQKITQMVVEDFGELLQTAAIEGENQLPDIQKESISFLELKINTINKLLFTLDRDDYVHDLRKELKQLFFVLQFLKQHFPDNHLSDLKLKNLRKITERIGHWNDRDVFVNMLHEFIEGHSEDFLIDNPEHTVLQYALKNEKSRFLQGIAVNTYLELINLKVFLQKAA